MEPGTLTVYVLVLVAVFSGNTAYPEATAITPPVSFEQCVATHDLIYGQLSRTKPKDVLGFTLQCEPVQVPAGPSA